CEAVFSAQVVAMRVPVAATVVLASLLIGGCGRTSDAPSKPGGADAKQAGATPALPQPPQAKYQRDLYRKLEDCVVDRGFAAKCTPLAANAPERAAQGGAFFGPIYSNALRCESQLP